jgi:hypothetical protein
MDSLLLSKDLRYFPKIAQVEIERKADVRVRANTTIVS